ncbi:TIGR04141 family sporadically distributed protein [Epilithonimonas sp.]|uniref:TIGR04141 family sporadically distributed protein n=1 Tax=Epilithonimonas sp. TaxID=2894511 RepID=UPI0028A230B2|nr:TIGR04141 family sporadically distributed protein [Epilithonimonas sp.]
MNIIPTIYRIDKNNLKLNGLENEQIILKILKEYKASISLEEINTFHIENIHYHLFTLNTEEIESDWKNFFPQKLRLDKNFTQQKLSLVLFIENEYDIYSVIGGNAYKIILPFIDQSFGIDWYSRIINPTEDSITSIKSRGITGNRAGLSEQYRDDFKIIDYIKFGKVPQEIHIKLNKKTSKDYFKYLLDKKNPRINITTGKGFKIKKDINFNSLHRIIKEFSIIRQLAPSDFLSSYEEIKDKLYIENNLKNLLIDKIYDDIAYAIGTANISNFQFDFCNPNSIEDFYEADEFRLKEKTDKGGHRVFKTINNKEDIYSEVIKYTISQIENFNKFNFMVFLQGIRICCYKNKINTRNASFLFHFNSEFKIENQSIFLIDNKWYFLRNSFIDDLKVQTKHILSTYKLQNNFLNQNWEFGLTREGLYNLKYDNLANYFVTDTIISDGIELCDIIYFDDNNIYLTHVKQGFTASMRELTNQILISAKRLKDCLGSDNKKFLEKIYKQLVEKGRNFNSLSLDEFIKLFDTRKKTFVLAFTSQLASDAIVEHNLNLYNSNIAKFSLIECSSEMRIKYYDMEILQISRS